MNNYLENLSSFLKNNDIDRINIPIYQRSYEWKKQQVDQFIEDLENLINEDKRDSYQFLGMIVYVTKEDNSREIEIIDGQQRITSYLLLCVLIYDWLHYEHYKSGWGGMFDAGQKEKVNKLKYDLSEIIYTKESVKDRDLTLKIIKYHIPKLYTDNTYKKDAEMTDYLLTDIEKVNADLRADGRRVNTDSNPHTVRKSLFNPEKGTKAIIKELHLKTAKSRPVFKNQNYFAEWFRDYIGIIEDKNERFKRLDNLVDVLTSKIKIIPFKTDNHTEAFTLFEVLNDRGLQVSQADLLKNLCIRRGETQEEKKEIYDCWQEAIDENLSENNKIAFLRTAYNSKYDFIRQKEVYKSYKKLIDSKDVKSLKDFINNELMEDVRNYNLCILESSDINNDIDENLQKYITLLYHSDTVQWRSILLSVLRKYKSVNNFSKQKVLIDIVKEVFEIIFTMVADNNARFNLIEQDFPKFARQINDNESYDLILTNIKNFKKEKRLDFKMAEIDIRDFESNKFCALFLLMYRFNIDISSVKNKKWTVEHILPQKPKYKDWQTLFPNLFSDDNKVKDQAKEDYIYSIGNMTLLEDKQNKSLGNLSFDKKKKKLLENNIVDIIDEKNEFNFKNVDEWNVNVINGRYQEIKNNISKTFKGIKF